MITIRFQQVPRLPEPGRLEVFGGLGGYDGTLPLP